ncbi:conserved hypothetical protein [Neospora caninum Liverpool]|uniref:Uncharacterized protein n=1 Tax=Neospora caninum (strain Liverpool) TaxID=572307 RepID=F0VNJ5_NEOCL|nr:conserved hypothetical protein [Neospora caninum Liverpool]CBZ55291.1 conserved hypothetical protein [Neospora caninum Liverpool]CEL70023.1 TPA: hypothetical protein BN1204_057140 [Neospora caninum Liverpool]|eukprot:XP_003885319.1 conserved hypothetical protein [Neospora caninum Liverpool]
MPFFSTPHAFVFLPSIFLYCCLGHHPFISPQYAVGQEISYSEPPETATVTRTTTARPQKPPKTRSSRHPVPPIPDEDRIVLNPVRFGHFLHPAGEPVFLVEEGFGDSSSPTSASSSSVPTVLPVPDSSATSPQDASASPNAIDSSEGNQHPNGSSGEVTGKARLSSAEPVIGMKHLPRPAVSGHVIFPQEDELGSSMNTGEESQPRSSLADYKETLDSGDATDQARGELRSSDYGGLDGFSLADGNSGRAGAEQGAGASSLPSQSTEREREPPEVDRDTRREPDDIFIDDPIFGDEKTYNFAGELIAVGNTKVEKLTQERDKGDKQTGKTTSGRDVLDQDDETAGPLAPAPNLGSPLKALDGIITGGFFHLSAT